MIGVRGVSCQYVDSADDDHACTMMMFPPEPDTHPFKRALFDVLVKAGAPTILHCADFSMYRVCLDHMAVLITQAAADAGIPCSEITVHWEPPSDLSDE